MAALIDGSPLAATTKSKRRRGRRDMVSLWRCAVLSTELSVWHAWWAESLCGSVAASSSPAAEVCKSPSGGIVDTKWTDEKPVAKKVETERLDAKKDEKADAKKDETEHLNAKKDVKPDTRKDETEQLDAKKVEKADAKKVKTEQLDAKKDVKPDAKKDETEQLDGKKDEKADAKKGETEKLDAKKDKKPDTKMVLAKKGAKKDVKPDAKKDEKVGAKKDVKPDAKKDEKLGAKKDVKPDAKKEEPYHSANPDEMIFSQCQRCTRLVFKPLRCDTCKKAEYCSDACQKRDWTVHKHVCMKTMDSMQETLMTADKATQNMNVPLIRLEVIAEDGMRVPIDMRGVEQEFDDSRQIIDELGPKGVTEAEIATASAMSASELDDFIQKGAAKVEELDETFKTFMGTLDEEGPSSEDEDCARQFEETFKAFMGTLDEEGLSSKGEYCAVQFEETFKAFMGTLEDVGLSSEDEYCAMQFDITDDKKKGLERNIVGEESNTAAAKESIATLTQEIGGWHPGPGPGGY